MKSITRLLFFLVFNVKAIQSIGQAKVKGTIQYENSQPVEFASIVLLSSSDSTLVKGALSNEEGRFEIDQVVPGSYLIMASYLGYENTYSQSFSLGVENKIAEVSLRFKTQGVLMKEAVIVGKKPFLEQKSDRLIVNVESSALAAGGTAMEILQKVPGIVILQDRVTLGGSQGLQVWIDGKPSPYIDINTLLRDMLGDQIEKIELITQPGAQFDAAGGAILNVVLKRNASVGLKGTAMLTLGGFRVNHADVGKTPQNYHRWNPSLNLTYRAGKFNLFSNISYNEGETFNAFIVDRFIGIENFSSKNLANSTYSFANFRIGGDYYLSESVTTGISGRHWRRSGTDDGSNITDVFDQILGLRTNSFVTDNIGTSSGEGTYANWYLKKVFDKKTNRQLILDFDINQFDRLDRNQYLIYPTDEPSLTSRSEQIVAQPVNLLVGKIDYTHPIDSTTTLELGAKYSHATVDNKLEFLRNGQTSEEESNDFLYKEIVSAAYVNVKKQINQFDISAGLRLENTQVNGVTLSKTVLDSTYTQLFPSAGIIYKVNQNFALQSSYSLRINRPSFQQQNPFTFFIDSLTYTRGNPGLRPEIMQTAQFNVTYDGQPFFGISYASTSDVIVENAPQLEGTKTFTTAANLAQQKRLQIQLNFPIKIGKRVNGFGGNQAILNSYNAAYNGGQFNAKQWNWLAYWQLNGELSKAWKVELGGFYMTRFLEEFLLIDPLAAINLGISYTFDEDRARISCSFNDILYTQKTNAVIDYQDILVNFFQRNFLIKQNTLKSKYCNSFG